MDGLENSHRFQLDDDGIANGEIQPMYANRLAAIGHGHESFTFKGNTPRSQLYAHSISIHWLQVPRADVSMDDKTTVNELCNLRLHGAVTLRVTSNH